MLLQNRKQCKLLNICSVLSTVFQFMKLETDLRIVKKTYFIQMCGKLDLESQNFETRVWASSTNSEIKHTLAYTQDLIDWHYLEILILSAAIFACSAISTWTLVKFFPPMFSFPLMMSLCIYHFHEPAN